MKKKPNIVLIFADDLGYGDVSCFNPEPKIKTKNIDALANEGIRFTDSHATSALCTPSRYGLLTGRYNWRSRLKSFVLPGDSEALIEKDRKTIAHLLKENGYNTAAIGKWHLGLQWKLKDKESIDFEKYGLSPDDFNFPDIQHGRDENFDFWLDKMDFEGLDIDYSQPINFGPNQLGFDYFFGTPASHDQPPYVYIENDRVIEEPTEVTGVPNLNRIDASQQTEWQNGLKAPNFDFQEVPVVMQEKVLEVIDRFTEEEKPFFLYYPTHLVHGPILPAEEYKGKSGIGPYGDYVLQLDDYVGQIVNKLQEKGVFEDTIIIFTSDNGASGVADFEALEKHGHHPSYIFRGLKGDIWEGGHREPTIVSYPRLIKRGTVSDHVVSHSDFYRTLAELLDAEISDDVAEDSVSNLPLWKGEDIPVREDIIHSSGNGGLSIRRGHWKLEFVHDGGGMTSRDIGAAFEPAQLYDLRNDIGETKNVIEDHPEVVESLKKDLEKYIKEGRSTPGKPQENDSNNPTGEWPQIKWMDGYEQYISRFKND